jgi:hypothetical protein
MFSGRSTNASASRQQTGRFRRSVDEECRRFWQEFEMILLRSARPAVLVLTVAVAAACADTITAPDFNTADIQGLVTQTNEGGGFLVEENPDVFEPTIPGGSKIWFSVGSEAEIQAVRADGSLRDAVLTEIRVNTRVAVWSTGLMLPSYPAGATASRVVILR